MTTFVTWEEVYPEHKNVLIELPSLIGSEVWAAYGNDYDVRGVIISEQQLKDQASYEIKVTKVNYGRYKVGDTFKVKWIDIGWIRYHGTKFVSQYQFAEQVAREREGTKSASRFMSEAKHVRQGRGWWGDTNRHADAAKKGWQK